MALEIIVRRRRSTTPPPDTDTNAREKSDLPESAKKEDQPANDNDGAWPFIPFPDGW